MIKASSYSFLKQCTPHDKLQLSFCRFYTATKEQHSWVYTSAFIIGNTIFIQWCTIYCGSCYTGAYVNVNRIL